MSKWISASLATTAFAAVTYSAQKMFAPTGQSFGQTFVGSPGIGNLLALSYDDGPNTAWTPALLDVLDKYQAKATFFCLGKYAREQPELVREIVARGHVIGNHSYSHPSMLLHSDKTIRRELAQATAAIEAAGVEIAQVNGRRLMRPPYGHRRPGALRVIAAEGYLPVMWSVTLWDWLDGVTPDQISRKASAKIRGGDVILLHDGSDRAMGADRSASVDATVQIIERWRAQGMQFVTIPAMIAATGFVFDPGGRGQ